VFKPLLDGRVVRQQPRLSAQAAGPKQQWMNANQIIFACNSFTKGRIVFAKASSVSGPICL